MSDPIHNPLVSEDEVYADAPAAATLTSAEQKAAAHEKRVAAADLLRKRATNELVAVLNTDAGRAVIMRLLDFTNPYKSTISFGHPDASAFDEGKRAVGLWLIDQITRVAPDAYPKLLLAHVDRRRQDAGAAVAPTA